MSPKFITSIHELEGRFGLKPGGRDRMETVCAKYPFREI